MSMVVVMEVVMKLEKRLRDAQKKDHSTNLETFRRLFF